MKPAALALGLGLLAQTLLTTRFAPVLGWTLYLAAVTLLAWAFRKPMEEAIDQAESQAGHGEGIPRRNVMLGLTMLTIAFLLAVGGVYWLTRATHLGLALLACLSSLAFASWGFARVEDRAMFEAFREAWQGLRGNWMEVILLTLIVFVAAFMRIYRLDQYPPPYGALSDEPILAQMAHRILTDPQFRPIYSPMGGSVAMYQPIALSFYLFGVSMLTLRLPSILVGILTVIPFHLLGRQFLRPKIALAMTSLFALSYWHSNFSRFAFDWVYVPLFETLCFYFLLRGIRSRRGMCFVWAGFFLSLGLYSYIGFRLVPIIVLVFLAHQAIFVRGFLRRHWLNLVVLFVTFLIFAFPFASVLAKNRGLRVQQMQDRIGTTVDRIRESDEPLRIIAEQISTTYAKFNYAFPRGAWPAASLPEQPLLDPLTSVFFILGLGYCVYHWRRSEHFLLVCVFFLTTVIGGILATPPFSYRFFGVVPVVYLFIGVLVQRFWHEVDLTLRPLGKLEFHGLLLALVIIVGSLNYHIFFNRHMNDCRTHLDFLRPSGRAIAIMDHIKTMEPSGYVYLVSDFPWHFPLREYSWMVADTTIWDGTNLLEYVPNHDDVGNNDVVYVITEPLIEAAVPLLRRYYPEGELYRVDSPPCGEYRFISYRVKHDDLEATWGLTGSYYNGTEWQGAPAFTRRDPAIDFHWALDEAPLPGSFSIQWEGTIYLPQYAEYAFATESAGHSQVYLDGHLILDNEDGRARWSPPLTQAQGRHHILARYRHEADGDPAVKLYWASPGFEEIVVPSWVLGTTPAVYGLLGTYYGEPDWKGEPITRQIDPSYRMRFGGGKLLSMTWEGQIDIEQGDQYTFGLTTSKESFLYIGETLVVHNEGHADNFVYREGSIELQEGRYPLRIEYNRATGDAGMTLYWTLPGGQREIVPVEVLSPYLTGDHWRE